MECDRATLIGHLRFVCLQEALSVLSGKFCQKNNDLTIYLNNFPPQTALILPVGFNIYHPCLEKHGESEEFWTKAEFC